jgi:hypothetical protein
MKNRRHLAATTVTPEVKVWLNQPTAVSLLHIFDRVINLIDTNDTILSVVQSNIGAGPFSLVVNGERPFPTIISAQDTIRKTNNRLQIGSLQIDLRPATLWQPRPSWDLLRNQPQWLTILPELQTAVSQQQDRLTQGSPAHFAPCFHAATSRLREAIAHPEADGLATAVAQLAGLGPGFTPAGDDFLLGMLLGLWATRPEAKVVELARTVVETAVPRTTQLSAAWLKAASRGEAALPWHHLTEALLADTDWEAATNAILNTGATSGIAALMGFTAVATNSST